MSLSTQLAYYLRRHGVSYLEIPHEPVFTPADIATVVRLQDRGLAKVVGLRSLDGDWILVVVPSGLYVDLEAVQLATGQQRLRVASELDVARHFGSAEIGGAAAFDDLSGISVCLDEAFGARRHVYFPDGSRSGVFAMRVRDYIRLARPIVGAFAMATRHQIRSG
jgi:prolyl-tRNA editing enzyme YbaK/EbsC (Cys-tRNA(Pro) deacylase)